MMTGRKVFDESTQARVIAAILASDPARLRRPPNAPARLWWVMQHCLQRAPGDRWRSMGDVAKVLKDIASEGVEAPPPRQHERRRNAAFRTISAGLIGIALLGSWFAWSRAGGRSGPRPAVVASILPPPQTTFALTARSAQLALAPDGRSIAFIARAGGLQQLWIRDLGAQDARPLAGTTGASFPFWSPDGRWIGFFAGNGLRKVGLTGRPPVTICEALTGRGGTWVDNETIVFSPDNSTGLRKVSAAGGTPEPLTSLEPGHLSHRWPQALPGGNLLFFVRSADAVQQGLYVTSLAQPARPRRLRSAASSAVYASGALLYVIDGQLVAQAFDPSSLTLSGDATPLGVRVTVASTLNPALSASTTGALAAWHNVADSSDLVWHDRGGNRLGTAGSSDRYVDFRLSPDERRLAVSRVDAKTDTVDLVVFDLLNRAAPTSLSSSPQTDASPVWSPDGQRLVFRSNRQGVHDLFERPANGGGADRLLYSLGLGIYPTDWSAERDVILFHALGQKTRHDIWMVSPSAPGRAQALYHTPAEEVQAQLGPGGRLAYASDESGVMNVYVRNVDDAAGPVNVSVDGGVDPRWRADGRELFFISPDGSLMSTEVSAAGPLRVMRTTRLFKTSIAPASPPYLSHYGVTRDGARFLIHVPFQPTNVSPLTLMIDWPSALSDRPR
jgi:Tol biopolymer transport system component